MKIDKGSESYNKLMKSWLKNSIEMYSMHNEGKSAVAERLIRTSKTIWLQYLKMFILTN